MRLNNQTTTNKKSIKNIQNTFLKEKYIRVAMKENGKKIYGTVNTKIKPSPASMLNLKCLTKCGIWKAYIPESQKIYISHSKHTYNVKIYTNRILNVPNITSTDYMNSIRYYNESKSLLKTQRNAMQVVI